MKKVYKLAGKVLLGMAALIAVVGPASYAGIGVEEIPESIKNKR
ncbi:hypothetical protein SAMN05444401_1894 [Clostridium amylolyticum]|uniref:Uncharacterized protein n=1 Tax=Clostridium amylolyticum TaxID=1121298 RepID=A0A1M6FCU3_9CLOT|nr:hypothetical protein [Clostridium amylolyticum]SHI95502.1 hypothetical protein SAMN05444401_1894 [Clostridium amylolyticum]